MAPEFDGVAPEELFLFFRTAPAVVEAAHEFEVGLPELREAQGPGVARFVAVEFIRGEVEFFVEIPVRPVVDPAVQDLVELRHGAQVAADVSGDVPVVVEVGCRFL